MQTLSSPKSSFWRSGWFLTFLLAGLGWLLPTAAHATHLRAGDIQAKVDTTPTRNPNRIFFKLTLYRDPRYVQQNTIRVYYGDGKTSDLDTPSGIPKSTEVSVSPTANVITFYFEHTYPGSGRYTASMVEANRVAGVVNMTGSVNQTFYISTTLTVDPGLGQNSLPVLKAPAIDAAAAGQVFLHNPAAYDADGDSLGFRLMQSQQVALIPNPLPASFIPTPTITSGYQYPNSQSFDANGQNPRQVSFLDNNGNQLANVGANASLTINNRGQLIWNAPLRTGTYNVAIIVEEWRKNALGAYIMRGEVLRDMQIDVVATTNLPPVIRIPQDTCVIAGAVLNKSVTAVDGVGPNAPATPIQLFAYSGIIPPATFRQSTQGPPRAVGRFNWATQCENIAAQPYLVVFKAQDTPHTPAIASDPPLIDEKTWRVTVVGPAPTNLQATVTTNQRILLTWASYPCLTSSQPGVLPTIQIYRRENSYPFTPGPCETGIPAAAGYTRIASIPANLTAYTDDNNGAGLARGRTYCYRIYVTFPLPAGGASLASNESCSALLGRSAQLTNVDVLTTAPTNGQIAIKWTQPRPNVGSFNAPLGYRLSRSSTGAAPFTLVTTKTSLTDTTYVDSAPALNTQDGQYTYQLVFFSAATTQPGSAETSETSPLASSVRLGVVPDGNNNLNTLTWSYQVPWDNSTKPTLIFRRLGATGPYAQVATLTPSAGASSVTYVDRGLTRGANYCYYVQTNGQYTTPTNSLNQPILTNLLNRSQEICALLIPTPCTPVLTVVPTNCDSLANLDQRDSNLDFAALRYQNRLRWTLGNTPAGCSGEVAYFRIFYRSTAEGPFTLIDSTTQYTYLHQVPLNTAGNTGGAGCYQVQAVNAARVRSALSNVACQDNCAFFLLPNIFTPNGDGLNERFRPKTASAIRRTHVQIFNRWGRKVYESDKDPYINWDGGGPLNETGANGKVSNGLYYYLAEVEFADFAGTKRTYKGWVEIVR
ncbi:gliding motility-associated C-terminal domain-containing protein [Hymenobacter bucti]|uniref:Gliding motility-associated C-terminal domain-containing protein n=1 Tax=Hymenobacter bucti TaxID=1844114 RepID=A0ABW4QQF0_9BACT